MFRLSEAALPPHSGGTKNQVAGLRPATPRNNESPNYKKKIGYRCVDFAKSKYTMRTIS